MQKGIIKMIWTKGLMQSNIVEECMVFKSYPKIFEFCFSTGPVFRTIPFWRVSLDMTLAINVTSILTSHPFGR